MTVYIASPYTKGDVACNIHRAILTADLLIEMGHTPYVPVLTHFWHLVIPHPWEFWIEYDLKLLPMFDCVLRIPGESEGADREVAQAKNLGIPVYYSLEELNI